MTFPQDVQAKTSTRFDLQPAAGDLAALVTNDVTKDLIDCDVTRSQGK